ncbi:MAG TPA: sulfocyanin-like copper-binding protein [Gemmatimonadaceae bacterium]|nr:sulfocyanin-like copper-binding protein [Gemmatimonadaceae bacterium]
MPVATRLCVPRHTGTRLERQPIARPAAIAGAIAASLLLSAIPASGAAQSASVVKVNDYLSYDADAKKVTLSLVAGDGDPNGGMNFDRGFTGNKTITIPAGWTVTWHFVNHDAIPHSAIVLPDNMPFPAIPQTPAIGGAYSVHLTDGIPTDGTDEANFTASPAGTYVIACGVPGHAPSGMWIRFVVSATATEPSFTPQ